MEVPLSACKVTMSRSEDPDGWKEVSWNGIQLGSVIPGTEPGDRLRDSWTYSPDEDENLPDLFHGFAGSQYSPEIDGRLSEIRDELAKRIHARLNEAAAALSQ